MIENLLEGREVEVLSAVMRRAVKETRESWEPSLGVPGTVPEIIVYNYLNASEVEFYFQHAYLNSKSTAFPESIWIADFYLPAYNTYIEVYGNYWHALDDTVTKDTEKKAFWLSMGLEVIDRSKAVDLIPSQTPQVGKVVIWWESDIRNNISELFITDLPEVSARKIPGKARELEFDAIAEYEKRELNSRITGLKKSRPKIEPIKADIKNLKKKAISANFYERNIKIIQNTRRIK